MNMSIIYIYNIKYYNIYIYIYTLCIINITSISKSNVYGISRYIVVYIQQYIPEK